MASEPVPEAVVERAQAVFDRRSHAGLAALVLDSLVDASGSPADHVLRFEHSEMRIDLRVSAGAETANLSGVVLPPSTFEVRLEAEGSSTPLIVPASDGTFVFAHVAHGVVRLNLTDPGRTTLVSTDWFRV